MKNIVKLETHSKINPNRRKITELITNTYTKKGESECFLNESVFPRGRCGRLWAVVVAVDCAGGSCSAARSWDCLEINNTRETCYYTLFAEKRTKVNKQVAETSPFTARIPSFTIFFPRCKFM